MTLLLLDGFETIGTDATAASVVQAACDLRYSFSELVSTTGDSDLVIDYESSGSFALRTPAQSGLGVNNFFFDSALVNDGSIPVSVTGLRIHTPSAPKTNFSFIQCLTSSGGSGGVALQITGNCQNIRIVDDTGIVDVAGVISPETWYYLEWEARLATSADGGYHKLYVDGLLVYDSGARTVEDTDDSFGYRIWTPSGTTNTGEDFMAYDDLYAISLDGTTHTKRLGPIRIRRHSVTADTAQKDWTPSTGTDNYALIDERTVDDTEYVESSEVGNIDEYDLSNSVAGIGTPRALVMEGEGLEDSASTDILHVGVTDGTASETGKDLGTSATFIRHYLDSQPTSGSPLDVTSVDALKARIRHGS